MEKQIIISISREYGSGGREIGEKLANKLEMEFYDRKLLESIYNVNNIDTNVLHKFDEKARKKFFSRTVRGMSNSPELNLAEMQFNLLKQRAADGDSFVVLVVVRMKFSLDWLMLLRFLFVPILMQRLSVL